MTVDDCQPVDDDELLYRRIPAHWYDPQSKKVSPEAFAPHKTNDPTGLSVWRGSFVQLAQIAAGPRSDRQYYVAVLRAGDVRRLGLQVEARPLPGGPPGHAEITSLTSQNRKTNECLEATKALSEIVIKVHGPFHRVPGP